MPDWSVEIPSREELELMQLERLQSTLNRAYRQVKFYRRQFDQRQLRPDDIQDLTQVGKLPFTTRDDLSRKLSLWLVRGASARCGAHPVLSRHHGKSGRSRLHCRRSQSSGGNSAPACIGAPMWVKTILCRLSSPAV